MPEVVRQALNSVGKKVKIVKSENKEKNQARSLGAPSGGSIAAPDSTTFRFHSNPDYYSVLENAPFFIPSYLIRKK